jgi:hypothetical protein
MKNIYWLVSLCFSVFIVACNGHSGDGATTTTAGIDRITLSISNSEGSAQQSFAKNDVVTVVASVFDENNIAIVGANVSFSTTIGELSPAQKLTNDDGEAIVIISNTVLAIGAGTIQSTINGLSATVDFEFLETTDVITVNSLTSQLLLDGISINRFNTDQQAEIVATLLASDNTPIENEIITFTAENGILSADSSLTNSQGIASVTLTGDEDVGAGVITISSNVIDGANLINYELLPESTVINDTDIRIGSFDENNVFVDATIGLSVTNANISAGGTLGLTIELVDSNDVSITSPTPITFTSSCVASTNALVDETVFTVNGTAHATFQDISCAGNSGVNDVLIASVVINGVTKTATASISIDGEDLGSIAFLSAEPTSIVLNGTGGQGKQETSTLTFQVKGALDNPLAQQEVSFSLDTVSGGISLNPLNGLTNSQGLITTQVTAGTVPAAVRVTAQASNSDASQIIQTQSDLLSINTGLPEQRSITLSASLLNPEADRISGLTSTIFAYLADNFNNPVPDGTTVNFTTEGGVIEPSCNTTSGQCSVTWTSAEPRVADHRITILATALGHETFFDTNGNNTFDDADGSANTNMAVSSGFGRISPQASGFIDMTEAWRDDNESLTYESGELFIDFNNDNEFSTEDDLFNAPQCEGSNCSSDLRSINVRKALRLIMSGSTPIWTLIDTSTDTVLDDNTGAGTHDLVIADNSSKVIRLYFSDTAGQTLPNETDIIINLSDGTLEGTTNFTVSDNNQGCLGLVELSCMSAIDFVIINEEADIGTLDITFITPSDFTTRTNPIDVTLQ